MSFNLGGVEDGEEFKKVLPGEYLAELDIKHIKEQSPKLSYFNLTYTLLEGQFKNSKVFARLYTQGSTPEKTETCKRMVRGLMKQAGTTKEQRDAIKEEFEVINLLNKRTYFIEVYEEADRKDPSKIYSRASLLRPAGQVERTEINPAPETNGLPF